MPDAYSFDVVIVGAGPAGCACALALSGKGLKVALIEKELFPRDKVCGDAIPIRALKTLRKLNPEYAALFEQLPQKNQIKHTTLQYNNRSVLVGWSADTYMCTRLAFDNFLFSLVQRDTTISIHQGTQVVTIGATSGGHILTDKAGNTFGAPMIVGADGAQSLLARQLTARVLDREHHVGAVRAYYSHITAMSRDRNEIFLDKRFLPGYLWIFPVSDTCANVGFGMLSSEVAKRKINIRHAMYDFIAANPALAERFAHAVAGGAPEGFSLPLGSRSVMMSGSGFLLVGDAASLIDPASGDGIGNAMASGVLAAEQIVKCFDSNDFSAAFLTAYEKRVQQVLGGELRLHYRVQRTLRMAPFLLNWALMLGANSHLQRLLKRLL